MSMKHLGDITRLNGADIEAVDVITGGSPCQDLSTAGKRAGLSGDRSGLFYEQMRLVREMREATGEMYPRFMVWENVPGALSTNKGADFKEVLNECVKIVEKTAPDVPMPKEGWPKAGVLYDDMGRWSIAWRIHDAQFWGVPQRRRRIALVCDFRGMSAPEVLFERQGARGDTATCGETRQGAALDTGGSAAEVDARRVVAVHQNSRNKLRLSDTAYALTAEQGAKPGQSQPVMAYQLVGVNSNSMKSSNPHSGCYQTEAAGTITANGCQPNNQGGTCIVERRVIDARGNGNGMVSPSITGDHDSRITDYTSVVTEPVACDKATIELCKPVITTDGKAPTLIAKGPGGVVTYGIDDVSAGTHRPVVMADRVSTLISHGANGVCALEGNGGRPGHKGPGFSDPGAPMYTLNTVERHAVCTPTYRAGNGQAHVATHITKELAPTYCVGNGQANAAPREAGGYVVRRLTPLECTRLQGYPDGWVDIGDWTDTKGKMHKDADTPKYKALGNSIALPFWKWLLARIYKECSAEEYPSLGSLFDGIGGFPLSWPGRTAWSSEIEEFSLAVLRVHFGEERAARQLALPF